MANDKIRVDIDTKTQQAIKDVANLAKAFDKVETSAKNSATAVNKVNKAVAATGGGGGGRYPYGHPGRGGGSLTGVAGFVPGGASAQSQFRNIFRAIGIAGLGTVMKQLNDSIIANTKALLDRAKEQQNQAKLNTLTDSQLKSNKVIVDELNKRNKNLKEGEAPKTFYDVRDELSRETGSTTDEINSILKSFAGEVKNFEELSNLTKEIIAAAKLGVSDISTLIDVEKQNLKTPGAQTGQAITGISYLSDEFKNVFMDLIDEIQANNDFGASVGIAKFYGDRKGEFKIEESMQKLNALMEENSLQGLRKYDKSGQMEGLSGVQFLQKLVEFTNQNAANIGITGEQTIDRYVERGDMSQDEANIFKEIYRNFDEFKNYINNYNLKIDIDSTEFQQKLKDFTTEFLDAAGTIPNPNYNKSFAQSIESDKLKAEESIKISSPVDNQATDAQKAQNEFTKIMSAKGFDKLREGPEGQIPMTPYNEFLNFSTKSLENSFEPIAKIGEYFDDMAKPIEGFIDTLTNVPKGLIDNVINSGLNKISDDILSESSKETIGNIYKNIFKMPFIASGGILKNVGRGFIGGGPAQMGVEALNETSLSDLPLLNSLTDYAKTKEFGPSAVKYINEKGEEETDYVLGPALNTIVDLLGMIIGGVGGGKAAGKMADDVAKKVVKNLDTLNNMDTGEITRLSKEILELEKDNQRMSGYMDRNFKEIRSAKKKQKHNENLKIVMTEERLNPPKNVFKTYEPESYEKRIEDVFKSEQYWNEKIESEKKLLSDYNKKLNSLQKDKYLKETQLSDAQKLQTKLEASQKSWESGTKKTMSTWVGRIGGGSIGGGLVRGGVNAIGGGYEDQSLANSSLLNNPMQFNQNIQNATSKMSNDEYIQNLIGSSKAPITSQKQENTPFVNDFTASQKVRDEIALRQLKVQEELLAETKKKSVQDQIELNKNANKPYMRNTFR